MPKNKNIKKVLVIGSGPITIGQAAEFDYAGTQACHTLKNEKVEVDYIQRKFIKKVAGAAPGFVIYHSNYSLMAIPGCGLKQADS